MKTLQVVIPMAGHGSRFAKVGHKKPKPMIQVGPYKPMIQVVVENLGFRGDYRFLALSEHAENFSLPWAMRLVTSGFGVGTVQTVDKVTEGQASSVLLMLNALICEGKGDCPVIVANSDQFIDGWHPGAFSDFVARHDPDGALLTFHGSDPKWSFARVADGTDRILEVAEKKPISDRAIVGVFYAKSVELLRTAICMMMEDQSKRVNGEWYLAPAYNEIIQRGFRVEQYPVARMYGIGTPEDLQAFQALLSDGKVRV